MFYLCIPENVNKYQYRVFMMSLPYDFDALKTDKIIYLFVFT